MLKSGVHLRTVRNWIQRKAINGDTCTWNSDEVLRMKPAITPKLLEELAQQICDDIMSDVIEKIQRNLETSPKSFKVCYNYKASDKPQICEFCGHTREMHDIIAGKTW
jgi:hypothetical protein